MFFGKKDKELNKELGNIPDPNKMKEEQEEYDDEEDQIKESGYNPADFQEKFEDINQELRKAQRYKPVDGVEFTQYDRYGIKITEENR